MGLSEFLDRAAATPFQEGKFDCCLWLADWGRELTGLDGAREWRGTYTDADSCAAVLAAYGGVARVVRRGASLIGMKRLQEPHVGSVGVVKAILSTGEAAHVGGIYTGRRWAFLTPGGIHFSTSGHIAAWGL